MRCQFTAAAALLPANSLSPQLLSIRQLLLDCTLDELTLKCLTAADCEHLYHVLGSGACTSLKAIHVEDSPALDLGRFMATLSATPALRTLRCRFCALRSH